MATKPKPDDGAEPNRPMNRAKAQAYLFEKRLKEASVFELSNGNRRKITEDEIFEQSCVFRHMISCGIFKDIDELESTVFWKWGVGFSVRDELEFSTVDPKSGG